MTGKLPGIGVEFKSGKFSVGVYVGMGDEVIVGEDVTVGVRVEIKVEVLVGDGVIVGPNNFPWPHEVRMRVRTSNNQINLFCMD